jgi:hypothetical protein
MYSFCSFALKCSTKFARMPLTSNVCPNSIYFISVMACGGHSYSTTQSACLGIKYPCGTSDQILFPVRMLLSEIYGLVSMWRPLWREDGSAVCSVIIQWSESLRTRNHTLLSHLKLHQPGGWGPRIYIPQEQGGPVIPPGTGFPLRRHYWYMSLLNGRTQFDLQGIMAVTYLYIYIYTHTHTVCPQSPLGVL